MGLVQPKTYVGKDSEGNIVHRVTAADANNDINPTEVQTAIDAVGTACHEEMTAISDYLTNSIKPEADEAIIVEGAKLTDAFEQVGTAVSGLEGQIVDSIQPLYDGAVEAHDNLQEKYNNDAMDAAASGGCKVSEA